MSTDAADAEQVTRAAVKRAIKMPSHFNQSSMRIFVTGATGFIGSALVTELLRSGHSVLGLARNDAAAGKLVQAGVDVHLGELTDLDALAAAARLCDGVAHLAFIHDFSKFQENIEIDRVAAQAMTQALAGSQKPFVLTSGTAMVAPGRVATENDVPADPTTGRAATEEMVLATAARGVRASVVRLSPSVHDAGDYGFVPMLINLARRTGVSAYVAEGTNRWSAVHRLDAALLFRLALEKALPGTRLHGAAEEGIPMRQIAETIGEGLGLPVRSIAAADAASHFDWFAGFVQLDSPTSSEITRQTLGWSPMRKGLLADMKESGYFDAVPVAK
jgi:nucleoside-diphosphate-sugar epimerase